MKALILISSIFYILGLKISNKIELVNKSTSTEKIIKHKTKSAESEKAAKFEEQNDGEHQVKEEKILSDHTME